MNYITENAPAKINLFLKVCGKLENGFHSICTVMQSVSLCDEVTLTPATQNQLICSAMPESKDNLAFCAAVAFQKAFPAAPQVKIELKKNIPITAGLGGGSADAAAVLRGLNRLCGNVFTAEQLCQMGVKLGADVPFCIVGGTVLCQGIGEQMTALPSLGHYEVVLVKRYQKQSTAEMYAATDRLTYNPKIADGILKHLKNGQNNPAFALLENDFLTVSQNKAEQQVLLNTLKQNGAVAVGLSGSGPTVFGLFESEAAADQTAKCFEKGTVWRCHTL